MDRRVYQLKEEDFLFPNMVPEGPCTWYAEVLQTVEGPVPYDIGDWELTNEVSQSGVLNAPPQIPCTSLNSIEDLVKYLTVKSTILYK